MKQNETMADLALQDLIKSWRWATEEENESVNNYIKEISRFYSGKYFLDIIERKKKKMLEITLKNGTKLFWNDTQYDDYKYDGKCLILIKNNEYVGLYNIDSIICMVRKEKE